MKPLWGFEDGGVRLRLHKAQESLWDSQARFSFLIIGTQGGKTTFLPWILYREIYGLDGYKGRGKGDYLAVTATYDLFKLKMLPAMLEVFVYGMKMGKYWSGDKVLELRDPNTGRFWAERASDPMWGRVILRSAESPGGLESATVQAVIGDEIGQPSFRLDSWQAILRRLSLSQGRFFGGTTPYAVNWLKHEVLDRARSGDPNYFVCQAPSIVNPAFPAAEYERARSTVSHSKFRMFYDGQFERPEWLVFSKFQEARHAVEPFDVPPEWPRRVGVDFGGANTALVWVAEDRERRAFYVYRETLSGGLTTAEHSARALQHARAERVVVWKGGSKSETQSRMDWRACGVPLDPPVVSSVESGIDRLNALWGQDRLFVFRSCPGLIDDVQSYQRTLGTDGKPTEKIQDKETFHRVDALRYAMDDDGGGGGFMA